MNLSITFCMHSHRDPPVNLHKWQYATHWKLYTGTQTGTGSVSKSYVRLTGSVRSLHLTIYSFYNHVYLTAKVQLPV